MAPQKMENALRQSQVVLPHRVGILAIPTNNYLTRFMAVFEAISPPYSVPPLPSHHERSGRPAVALEWLLEVNRIAYSVLCGECLSLCVNLVSGLAAWEKTDGRCIWILVHGCAPLWLAVALFCSCSVMLNRLCAVTYCRLRSRLGGLGGFSRQWLVRQGTREVFPPVRCLP
jgi:hypothetical protein